MTCQLPKPKELLSVSQRSLRLGLINTTELLSKA
jgi:hypothetical protein